MKKVGILFLEDTESDVLFMARELKKSKINFDHKIVDNWEDFIYEINKNVYDLVIADYNLVDFEAPEAIEYIREKGLDLPIIVVTGSISEEVAVRCIKIGASDYLLKDRLVRLPQAIIGALHEKDLRDQRSKTLKELDYERKTLRSFMDSANEGFFIFDSNYNLININKIGMKMISDIDSKYEFLGRSLKNIFPEYNTHILDLFKKVIKTNEPAIIDDFSNPSSHEIHYSLSSFEVGRGFGLIISNITEIKEKEKRVLNLNSMLKAIREINKLIVHENDLRSLSKGVCRTLTDIAGYLFASFYRFKGHKIVLENYSQLNNQAIDPDIFKEKEIKLSCIEKLKNNPDLNFIEKTKEICEECHYASCFENFERIIISKLFYKKLYGFLVVSPPEDLVFEESLFLEVINDISYALYHLETLEEKHKVEDALVKSTKIANSIMESTIQTMAKIVEVRDPYTAGHQERVMQLAVKIAEEMHLSPDEIKSVKVSAIVHDIGKMNIPSEILTKPGKLTDIEFDFIKEHPLLGMEILKNINFPWPIADIVFQHHERINGSGYPKKLTENNILIQAKIIAVADVVEAMSSHRPYRPALGMKKAKEEIKINSGILYDKAVTEAFFKIIDNFQFK